MEILLSPENLDFLLMPSHAVKEQGLGDHF